MTITHISRNYLHQTVKKRNSKQRKTMLSSFTVLAVLVSCGATLVASGEVRKLYAQLPTADSIQSAFAEQNENSFIYDRNGELLYTIKDPNLDREYLHKEEITDLMRLAVMAAEDKDFYLHEGIDYIASTKAFFNAIFSSDDSSVAGGSTITQQLAKNTFLTAERSFERKIKEAILSLIIESEYDKEQILEYYLNTIPFGSRVTGLKTAAHTYFNKDLQKLNFNELAFLISIVQNPNVLSPLYSYDQDAAWDLNDTRRNYVLDQAIANYDQFSILLEDIPPLEELESYKESAIAINPPVTEIQAPHFVFYIRSILSAPPYNISDEDLYSNGYKIYTSLDLHMQRIAEQELPWLVDSYGSRYRFSNAAIISIDPRNGDILTMQGSKDYWAAKDPSGRFDPEVNVTLSSQNLGSSLKPFVAYLGFNQGLYSRNSVIHDTPQTFAGGYSPKNVDGRFMGTITVDTALKYSRNLPFVKMLNQTGTSNFNQLLKDLGYSNAQSGSSYGLAAALGGVSENLYDHAYAYSTLASGGVKAEPHPIYRIVDLKSGTENTYGHSTYQLLNSNAVAEVNRILGDKSFRIDNHWMIWLSGGYKFAGKTGTTDYNKQNYFIGYGPNILTAVWTGNNNNDPMVDNAFGSTTALPIWYHYTKRVMAEKPEYAAWGWY